MKDKSKNTILIVDDDEEIATLIDEYVSYIGDYNTVKALSGTEALKTARSIVPDLMLLDIMMDDMDGTEVCRNIKSNVRTSHVPVVAVTVVHKVHQKRYQEIMDSGVDAYVEKPFKFDELKGVINQFLPDPATMGTGGTGLSQNEQQPPEPPRPPFQDDHPSK